MSHITELLSYLLFGLYALMSLAMLGLWIGLSWRENRQNKGQFSETRQSKLRVRDQRRQAVDLCHHL